MTEDSITGLLWSTGMATSTWGVLNMHPKNTRKKAWHCSLANMTCLLLISKPQLPNWCRFFSTKRHDSYRHEPSPSDAVWITTGLADPGAKTTGGGTVRTQPDNWNSYAAIRNRLSIHPWKINMEPENYAPLEEENNVPSSIIFSGSMFIFRDVRPHSSDNPLWFADKFLNRERSWLVAAMHQGSRQQKKVVVERGIIQK